MKKVTSLLLLPSRTSSDTRTRVTTKVGFLHPVEVFRRPVDGPSVVRFTVRHIKRFHPSFVTAEDEPGWPNRRPRVRRDPSYGLGRCTFRNEGG